MTEGQNRIESSSEGDPLERRLQPLYHIGIFVCTFGLGALSAVGVMLVVRPDRSETADLVMFTLAMLMGAPFVAELLIRHLARRKARRGDSRRA